MTCSWCEEDNELIRFCNINNHNVCKLCYETYRKSYPLRVEGCPYCKGNEEKVIVRIHTTSDYAGRVAGRVTGRVAGDGFEPETTFTLPIDPPPQELECDNGLISVIICASLCLVFIGFCFSRVFMLF